MKVICKICGKKFINQDFLDKHFMEEHHFNLNPTDDLRRGWRTPYGFCDFEKPVSYNEACNTMKNALGIIFNKDKKP